MLSVRAFCRWSFIAGSKTSSNKTAIRGGSLGFHCMMQRFNIFGSIDYNQTFFQLEGIVFLVFTKSVSIHPSPSGDSWILSSKPPTIPFGIVVCLFFDIPSQNSYTCILSVEVVVLLLHRQGSPFLSGLTTRQHNNNAAAFPQISDRAFI